MKSFAIRMRHADGSDHYLNIFACEECSKDIAVSYPDAREIFEIAGDPGYDDICRLCGSSFFSEVEEHGVRRRDSTGGD